MTATKTKTRTRTRLVRTEVTEIFSTYRLARNGAERFYCVFLIDKRGKQKLHLKTFDFARAISCLSSFVSLGAGAAFCTYKITGVELQ